MKARCIIINIKKMLITSLVTVCLALNFVACSMGSDNKSPDVGNTQSQNNSANDNDLTDDNGKPNDTVDNNTEELKEDIKDGVNDVKDDMKDTVDDVKNSMSDANNNK